MLTESPTIFDELLRLAKIEQEEIAQRNTYLFTGRGDNPLYADVVDGCLVCPYCGRRHETPTGWNYALGRYEKMIVDPGILKRCWPGGCGREFALTRLRAMLHNLYWFPSGEFLE